MIKYARRFKEDTLKTFWKKAIFGFLLSLFGTIAVGTILLTTTSLLDTLIFRYAVILVPISILLRFALGKGLEYYGMKMAAKKFEVELEFFAQVRYDIGWGMDRIQMHREEFAEELEKRKLSWM